MELISRMLQLILWLEVVSQWSPGDRNMAATWRLGKWHSLDTHHPRYPGSLKSGQSVGSESESPIPAGILGRLARPPTLRLTSLFSRYLDIAALAVLVLLWVWQCPSWWVELALAPDC